MTGVLIDKTQSIGLEINDEETKLVYFSWGNNGRENFEIFNINSRVKEFKYLGAIVNSKN